MPRADVTPEVVTALESPAVRLAFFVMMNFSSGPLGVWSGVGLKTVGIQEFTGVGTLGSISTVEEGSSVEAKGITLTLSGIDATLLADVMTDFQLGLPVAVQLALLDADGAIIANPITSFAGRMDQPTISMDGTAASISINCESRLVDLNTPANRRYTDRDQRIDYPADAGFSFVNSIQNVTIFWGRHPSGTNNFTEHGG